MKSNEKNTFLKKLSEAAFPEVLNLLPNIIPGTLGMTLPFIGNVYLNFKQNEEQTLIKSEIEELKNKINTLDNEKQEKILAKIREICKKYLECGLEDSAKSVEIYTVDNFKIVFRDEEYVIDCMNALLDARDNEESYTYQYTDTIFSLNNSIIVNLLEYQKRSDLEELLVEIEDIINETCDVTWGKSPIKEIHFY